MEGVRGGSGAERSGRGRVQVTCNSRRCAINHCCHTCNRQPKRDRHFFPHKHSALHAASLGRAQRGAELAPVDQRQQQGIGRLGAGLARVTALCCARCIAR